MDVVGSEIGQKMRSAIKAKLTELGCYVDDELPDYVMVMVANKRTRSQMEDDLQLFLGDNTESFVNWLHQVLKKLQEVTVAAPLKSMESEKIKERSASKERKVKDKKEKSKKNEGSKKSKKRAKEKAHKKKDEKKKSKKKSKNEMIRPNIPPLLMNIEKESEPSITDVFAGQILKNHGIALDTHKDEPKIVEKKPLVTETKRPIIPIIDPASIPSQTSATDVTEVNTTQSNETVSTVTDTETVVKFESSGLPIIPASTEIPENATREEKIKEITEIEAKIVGLRHKLANELDSQNDSMSDDDDFLNIRTEADELINDFAEEVFQEISQPAPIVTPPLHLRKSRSPTPPLPARKVVPKQIPEPLPQIELNLPKRPIRERLGAPIQKTDAVIEKSQWKTSEKTENSPERLTPEREPEIRTQKSAKSRLGSHPERKDPERKKSTTDESAKSEDASKKLTSRLSAVETRTSRAACTSVVRVRPRPRVSAPASSLLLRAVADAHKSLLNIPPKIDPEPQTVKRALVLPMRRSIDPKKIVIQVPCSEQSHNSTDSISDNVSLGDLDSEAEEKSPEAPREDKEEYKPIAITKVIKNSEYVPTRTLIRRDDTLFIETINIHNTTIDKDKDTQFIVTMDGYHPNAFLAKKMMTEGLLNEDEEEKRSKPKSSDKTTPSKKGPTSGNNSKKGTKEIAKVVAETEVIAPDISNQIQPSLEVHNKATNSSNKESNKTTIEKRKSDSSLEDRYDEKQKTDASVTKSSVDIQKSDIVDEDLPIKKIKRAILTETEAIDSSKSDVFVEDHAPKQQENEVPLDKPILQKRKSDISEPEKRKSDASVESSTSENDDKTTPPVKKRKASPIIFDVHKKDKVEVKVRERTISASSDSHIVLTTSSNSHKYDTVPPLSQASKVMWCRAFPQCRYGAACAFAHPRCKFAAACTRRGCVYSHALNALSPPALANVPLLASHVVPAANYKSISAGTFPNLCKFYPSCSNPACHFYHPKPCRYGKACTNKLECNFYHHDVPGEKWKYVM